MSSSGADSPLQQAPWHHLAMAILVKPANGAAAVPPAFPDPAIVCRGA